MLYIQTKLPTSVAMMTIVMLVVPLLAIVDSSNVTEAKSKQVYFLDNLKATARCTCKYPQPRLIYIDELEEYRIPNAIYLPGALLIHRCHRSIGYCHAPAYVCSSVESHEENVTFHVKNLFNRPLKKPRLLTSLTLRNHTKCKCVKLSSSSNSDDRISVGDIPNE